MTNTFKNINNTSKTLDITGNGIQAYLNMIDITMKYEMDEGMCLVIVSLRIKLKHEIRNQHDL